MNVAIFTNPHKDKDYTATKKLISYILKSGCSVLMAKGDENAPYNDEEFHGVKFLSVNELCVISDFAIVLGGDGTILRVAKAVSKSGLALLGINLGRIGYIAEIEMDELFYLDTLLKLKSMDDLSAAGLVLEKRMMLYCDVIRKGSIIFSGSALNDVVISKGGISRMIDLEIISGNRQICKYRSDGIIFSTPTGSTAYSMSAGGPIIDPSIECICAVPVCAYMCINSSPVIHSANTEISVIFSEDRENKALLTLDGEDSLQLSDKDRVNIKKASGQVRLLRVKNIDFYRLLNLKLSGEAVK